MLRSVTLIVAISTLSACGSFKSKKSSESPKSEALSIASKKSKDKSAVPTWICSDLDSFQGYQLEFFLDASNLPQKAILSHGGFFGPEKIAEMKVCLVEPAKIGSDLPTVYNCNDTAWKDGYRVELGLGGYLPTIGGATVFAGGPEKDKEKELVTLACRKT